MEEIRNDDSFLAPKSHNILIYDSIKSFEKFYCEYAAKWLPRNEIVLVGTQYQTFDTVEIALGKVGIDVGRHVDEGTLKIIDAQQGYLAGDNYGVIKLATTLVHRARKEGSHGVSGIVDMGSFIGFQKDDELISYELSLPQEYEEGMLRSVCCYHDGDFARLLPQQKKTLLDHHSITIVAQE